MHERMKQKRWEVAFTRVNGLKVGSEEDKEERR
jgi:hypothetical protein